MTTTAWILRGEEFKVGDRLPGISALWTRAHVQAGTPSVPALFCGEPFTAEELDAARSWLHDHSLITGLISASGAVFGAEISAAGVDRIGEGQSFAGPAAGHANTSLADDLWRTPSD